MKNNKLISLLAIMLITLTGTVAFASDDDYDDDYKYNNQAINHDASRSNNTNSKYYDDDDDDYYINPSNLQQNILDYIKTNYDSEIRKAERDGNKIEVELQNGIELYFTLDGKLLKVDREDYNKKNTNDYNSRANITTTKYNNISNNIENKKLKEQYKVSMKAKLGNKLDNIDKTKLETIVTIIDSKLLEFYSDTTKTDIEKERLIAIYGAIRDLITEKLSEISTDSILDGLFK